MPLTLNIGISTGNHKTLAKRKLFDVDDDEELLDVNKYSNHRVECHVNMALSKVASFVFVLIIETEQIYSKVISRSLSTFWNKKQSIILVSQSKCFSLVTSREIIIKLIKCPIVIMKTSYITLFVRLCKHPLVVSILSSTKFAREKGIERNLFYCNFFSSVFGQGMTTF